MTPSRAGLATGLSAYLLWGLLTIYWKQLSAFGAFELIGWRITTAAVLMAVLITVRRRWASLRTAVIDRHLLTRVAIAAVLLSVNWTAYVWAVVNERVLETALGYYIAPLGTVALGVLVLRETLRTAQWLSLGLAAASVVVLAISYGRIPWIALALASTWSVYGYLKRQVPLRPVDSMAAETLLLAAPAVTLVVVLAGGTASVTTAASPLEWFYVLASGLATVVPLTLFAHAAQRVPLTVLGPMQYLIPSMNFLIGWLVYHEPLTASRVTGFALLWTGLALLTAETLHRTRKRPAQMGGPLG